MKNQLTRRSTLKIHANPSVLELGSSIRDALKGSRQMKLGTSIARGSILTIGSVLTNVLHLSYSRNSSKAIFR
nr:hypothetical protein [Tanacetum cinerariifolium]